MNPTPTDQIASILMSGLTLHEIAELLVWLESEENPYHALAEQIEKDFPNQARIIFKQAGIQEEESIEGKTLREVAQMLKEDRYNYGATSDSDFDAD